MVLSTKGVDIIINGNCLNLGVKPLGVMLITQGLDKVHLLQLSECLPCQTSVYLELVADGRNSDKTALGDFRQHPIVGCLLEKYSVVDLVLSLNLYPLLQGYEFPQLQK